MADVFDKAKRSEIMSRIKGRGNAATELRLIKLLRLNKISGWRRDYPLFGKPDVVFPSARLAIFVDGEFWHGHPYKTMPSQNREFWERKISRNKARDQVVNRTLRRRGWRVIRIWQSELREGDRTVRRLKRLILAPHRFNRRAGAGSSRVSPVDKKKDGSLDEGMPSARAET
jgi:DNA mismatch endonuclease, patch repair protein